MSHPVAVLDTTVVLDWLVFRNVGVRSLVAAIAGGCVQWLGCPEMRTELAQVLAHARLAGPEFDAQRVLASFDRHCTMRERPRTLPPLRPRCRDASDQMFIDLALAEKARWLLTRDRDLLELARKVAPLGMLIELPEAWQLDAAGPWPG